MKSILKLLVAIALLNAVAHGAMAQWSYYQLKDSAQQLITFGADVSAEDLESGILQKAQELDIPLQASNVDVNKDGARSSAQVSYTQPVEFFPTYKYPMKFSFAVDAIAIRAGTKGPTRR
jgi:hypothetical protein